jgi:hypothetical protein
LCGTHFPLEQRNQIADAMMMVSTQRPIAFEEGMNQQYLLI